jgi:hypothetical protein
MRTENSLPTSSTQRGGVIKLSNFAAATRTSRLLVMADATIKVSIGAAPALRICRGKKYASQFPDRIGDCAAL